MAYLIDTNVLVRLANAADIRHAVATHAVVELHRRSEVLHLTAQVLIEFRNVATRPTAVNGLGLSAVDAEAQAGGFETAFPSRPRRPTSTRRGKLSSVRLVWLGSRFMTRAWSLSVTHMA
jgi:predicted nucleic acid-binding protein